MLQLTRREFAALLNLPAAAPALAPAPKRPANILAAAWSPEKLSGALIPRETWQPFPTSGDRKEWVKLPPEVSKALIAAGECHLGQVWPNLPATLFLDFVRTGRRLPYEKVFYSRRDRLRELVLAECVEAKGRFLDEILNGIWTTCEETFWSIPSCLLQKAGFGLPDPDERVVDIFGADTCALLAWTCYLLGPQLDKISPFLRRRIALEIDARLLTPCLDRVNFWWMGLDPKLHSNLNNWTTWIGEAWITSILLMETNPARRAAMLFKAMRSLDAFLAGYRDDGGCDEGPVYWGRAGGGLFGCLELLHSASNGVLDFYAVPLVKEIGRYIYRVHISENWFVNFADSAAKAHPSGSLMFRYGRAIDDEKLQAMGAWQAVAHSNAHDPTVNEVIGSQLWTIFSLGAVAAAPRKSPPFVRDAWLDGIQVMTARREEGSVRGLYLAAKGGHNAESHNHNDVGNFIVYADGNPVIVDAGVGDYTAKTFSPQRYDIWTMQSGYHNLPTIDGVMQHDGRHFAASQVSYHSDDAAAEIELNIEKAYPEEANLESWRRRVRLDRAANRVELFERYSLKKPVKKITLTLMTPCEVQRDAAGQLTLGPVRVLYDASVFSPVIEEIKIVDNERLQDSWGDRLFRVLLVAENPIARGEWRVQIARR